MQVYGGHLEPYGCTGTRTRKPRQERPLAPVRVNETPTLDFNDAAHFDVHHYAFHHVSDEESDAILRRAQEAEIAFGSDPWSREGRVNNWNSGRDVYLRIPTGTFWS